MVPALVAREPALGSPFGSGGRTSRACQESPSVKCATNPSPPRSREKVCATSLPTTLLLSLSFVRSISTQQRSPSCRNTEGCSRNCQHHRQQRRQMPVQVVCLADDWPMQTAGTTSLNPAVSATPTPVRLPHRSFYDTTSRIASIMALPSHTPETTCCLFTEYYLVHGGNRMFYLAVILSNAGKTYKASTTILLLYCCCYLRLLSSKSADFQSLENGATKRDATQKQSARFRGLAC